MGGPTLTCGPQNIPIPPDEDCGGGICAFFSTEGEYASCSDFEGCDCQIHISGLEDGDVVMPGRPKSIVITATNEFGESDDPECFSFVMLNDYKLDQGICEFLNS